MFDHFLRQADLERLKLLELGLSDATVGAGLDLNLGLDRLEQGEARGELLVGSALHEILHEDGGAVQAILQRASEPLIGREQPRIVDVLDRAVLEQPLNSRMEFDTALLEQADEGGDGGRHQLAVGLELRDGRSRQALEPCRTCVAGGIVVLGVADGAKEAAKPLFILGNGVDQLQLS